MAEMNPAAQYRQAQDQRAAEWHGLRPSAATACPRVVAGERCLASVDELCVCQLHHGLLDHSRMWLDADGKHVLTGEPYETTGEELAALVTDVTDLGLHVVLSGRSPWNPGNTLLLLIRQGSRP